MAVTAYTLPRQAVQAATVGYQWTNLSNILADDGTGATGAFLVSNHSWKTLKLIIGGTAAGTNLGTPTSAIPYTWPVTKGGSSNLWGNTLTPAIVNNYDFGIEFEIGKASDGTSASYIIRATDFGFNIPTDATIDGVELLIDGNHYSGGGGTTGIDLDSLQLRVYYTWAPKVRATGNGRGFVYSPNLNGEEPEKKFRYTVFDSDRNYVGEWKTVQNAPSFKTDINNLHSQMTIKLKQNELSTATAIDDILTEASENLTTEADENLQIALAAAIGLGPGTDTEVNNEVDITAFYGQFVELLTESGEVILTEADELILVQDGAPQGDMIFTGYIPEWELDFGDSDDISVPLLTHSQELNHIMLETDDTPSFNTNSTPTTSSIGIRGGGPTDLTRLCQVFRATSTTPLGRLRLYCQGGWPASDIPVSISIYNGATPSSPGSLIAEADSIIPAHPDDSSEKAYVDFYFDPFTPVNGNDYMFFIDTDFSKTGGNPTYPANFFLGSSLANGSLWYIGGPDIPSWTDSGSDLYFMFYQLGGATTRTFNSLPPETIAKQIIDFARTRGARVNYSPDSIDASGTVVSLTIKGNTIAEALDAVLKVCPADWYMYYDFGDNIFHLHARPETKRHTYTKGKDTVKLKVKRSILNIVNDVYFTGGGSPTPLYIRKTDQSLINDWRRGLAKLSDNRVTVQATAEILAQAEIDQKGEPIYSGNMRVLEVDFPIEEVTIGEITGLAAFGDLVDALAMQNMSITYHPEALDITLNTLTPKVQKRIEDIKRNLDALEQANNPTSPTLT